MTEKELLYLSDIYNHEKLIVNVINNAKECLQDEDVDNLFESHLKVHNEFIKRIEKELRSEADE